MSFYSDASLVMIPSGYKTSKVYSAVPTDGAGDLSFSRSNDTATRVGPNGLIEKVRTNLALQSQTFDNAAWGIVGGSSVTANTTTAPDGTLTADTLTVATNNFSGLAQTFTTSTNAWTISLFVKKGTKDFLYIFDPTTTGRAHFNLTTGAVATTLNVTASMTAVGNGWFRCSVTRSITGSAGHYFQFGLSDTDNTILPTSAGTAFIWGAQAEVSDFGATDYIATTSAAVSVGPVANVPRLDYLNSSCPRLLLEPQRTNLALNSETITAGTGATVSLNNAASPDGYVNADKLVEDTSTGFHRTNFNTSLGGSVDSSAYCISIFAKAAGRTRFAFWDNSQDASGYSYFDLSNGTVISGTGKIENYGNGWYRCTIFPLKNFSTSSSAFINLINTGTNESYTGDGTSGVLFWGKQLEVAAYATSYIPTLGAAVTRGADATYKGSISSLIGATEGVLFVDFIKPPTGTPRTKIARVSALLTDGGNSFVNSINLDVETNGNLRGNIVTGGVSQVDIQTAAYAAGTRIKMALAYKANDVVLYINGTQIGTDTSATIPVCTAYEIGSYETVGATQTDYVSQALLFKTRLSNADLAALTA